MLGEPLGPENAIWDDGEWIGWDEINEQIQYKEWGARYPDADRRLIPVFERLLSTAEAYYHATGHHLSVFGQIGELYAAITYGLKLHRPFAAGSDGRVGDDFVEVKTISPMSRKRAVTVATKGHFSKLLVVRVNDDFELSHRMIDRAALGAKGRARVTLRWDDL